MSDPTPTPNAIQRLREAINRYDRDIIGGVDHVEREALAAVDALYHATKHMHDTLRNLPNDEITIGVVFDLLAPVAAAVRQVEA